MNDRAPRPSKCPTCGSPLPELHPAVPFEGEVQICLDPWHSPIVTSPPDTPRKHDGEHCKDDEIAASVCEGIYAERTDEVLGLVEALQAISTLCAGHDEQSKAITKIIEDAIEEHAAWTR